MFTWLFLACTVPSAEPSRSATYTDVLSKVDLSKHALLDFKSTITTTHELTHDINHTKSKPGFQALYASKGTVQLFPIPEKVKLSDVQAYVPDNLKFHRYETYVVKQAPDRFENHNGGLVWIKGREDNLLYLLDEWVSYNNGAQAGLEEIALGIYPERKTDLYVGPVEMLIYVVALYQAIGDKDPDYLKKNPALTSFLVKEMKRAIDLSKKAQADSKIAWDVSPFDELVKSDLWVKSRLRKKFEEIYGNKTKVR